MDHRRWLLLRIAERGKQTQHPVEAQIDEPRVERQQPGEDVVADQGYACFTWAMLGAGLISKRTIRTSVSFSSLRGTTMSTMPCSRRYSERWKPSGSFSRIVSSMTRAPAKPITAPGSASVMSPSIANEAETPPVVGSVNRTM